ncbi:Rha family transcriptional regulator [Aurantimonas coralicida]|uniref:Rha family transcriptional regulator n=1 Tax=Aurantimonas coralicida TaxID=182270 RepID=UPI00138AAF21|nr:Rha family transcriptional regulator [Aurantimonas coralicida]
MTKARGIIAQTPAVFTRDGSVFANSRDVAAYFERRHDYVARAAARLARKGVPHLWEAPYIDAQNGQTYMSYDMNRDGFTLLAMGFTGDKVLPWKLSYIEAFNKMEKELASRPAVPAPVAPSAIDFNDTLQLSELATNLANFAKQMKERAEFAEAKIAKDAPKVAFAEDFGDLSGTYNLRTCGKMIGVPDREFFAHLRRRYLYEDVNGNLLPRAEFQNRGWFVVKPVPTLSRKAHFQTRVTAPGYQRLCRDFGRIDDLADMIPGGTDMRPKLALVQ